MNKNAALNGRNLRFLIFLFFMLSWASSSVWATPGSTPEENTPPEIAGPDNTFRGQLAEMAKMIGSFGTHLDALEKKLNSMSDKMLSTQMRVDTLIANQKQGCSPVLAHSGQVKTEKEEKLVPIAITPLPDDPESGFINDAAIKSYREAYFLYLAQKYPAALDAFSAFLENYPDHVLAGSAVFYRGDSHFKQKEFKLALNEFEQVLTSYDRSIHVTDTLKEMAEAEDHLQMSDRSARHRQLLSSLFPQSPSVSFSPVDSSVATVTAEKVPPPTAPMSEAPSEVSAH